MKILILFFLFSFFFISGCLQTLDCTKATDCPLTDEQYINIAKTTPEAQAFLQKYPDANKSVGRSGALGVEFRIENAKNWEITQDSPVPPYFRLSVAINPRTNKPTTKFVECRPSTTKDNKIIYQNIIEYIENENCLTS